jgi:hypothetical protein
MDSGTSLSYLGMQVSFDVSAVTIKMDYFFNQMVAEMNLKNNHPPVLK